MRILVVQPKIEVGTKQLEKMIKEYKEADIIIFPEDYIRSQQAFKEAIVLAKDYKKVIVTGMLSGEDEKRQGIIIDKDGQVLLSRLKTPKGQLLLQPSKVNTSIGYIGFMLCREIFHDFSPLAGSDLIVNPIGY